MRAHVVDIARYSTGEVAAGRTLTVYRDEAMTQLATLYPERTGATTTANPVVIPTNGVVDFWCDDSAPYGLAQGETAAYPLMVIDKTGVVNVCDYGAVGDGVTNDQAAFEAAIAVVRASGEVAPYGEQIGRPTLYVPPGKYLVEGFDIDFRSFSIRGEGKDATWIVGTVADVAIFNMGTFQLVPANPYDGTTQNSFFEGLTITSNQSVGGAYLDDYDRTGIQDNGGGWMKLRDVNFTGLKYGVFAPYGHDYVWYYDCEWVCCHTGVYFGPGSQQINMYGPSMAICDRGMVIENAYHGKVFGGTMNDCRTRMIDILVPDTLESGCTVDRWQSQLQWTFYGLWMEAGAGWGFHWDMKEMVRIGRASDTNYTREIVFRDILCMVNTAEMATKDPGTDYVWLNIDNGLDIVVDHIEYEGSHFDYLVTHPAADYPQVTVVDFSQIDGYPLIPWSKYPDRWYSRLISSFRQPRVSIGDAAPVSGDHYAGEIVYDLTPSDGGYIGWVCTAAGTPGTWKTFGAISA